MKPVSPWDKRVKLTVAICTWNRASSLSQSLERLTCLRQPRAPWELIVVNNNSDDSTEDVLQTFKDRLPLRRIFESALGLSHARNAAVKHATGDYVLWTDDDVFVDPGWLLAYERAVERWRDAAFFGGPVRPRFEGNAPKWVFTAWEKLIGPFGLRDLGPEPFEFQDGGEIPWGANFAVRLRDQRRFPYDPALGRKGNGGLLGEETAVIQAILASGSAGWWVPDAAVEHCIPKNRQTLRYLRDYYTRFGRTYGPRQPYSLPALAGHPWLLSRKMLQAELKYLIARLSGNTDRWVTSLIEASILWGALNK